MAVSKFQKFQPETITRAQIKNAPYNPRSIDAHARKKLKASLERVGLVESLVWNRRTGNLVGGHQRLSVLDDLEGSQEYSLSVAAIDVTEKREREINVLLNNPSIQGQYDYDLLQSLIQASDIKAEAMGFDDSELMLMMDGDIAGPFAAKEDTAAAEIEKINALRERKKASKGKLDAKDDAEFFIVAVFQERAQVDAFLKEWGFDPDCRYIDGRRLENLLAARKAPASPAP